MITAKNLQRAGFTAGKWTDLEGGSGRYRTWNLLVQPGDWLEVDEDSISGKPTAFIPSIFNEMGEAIFLNIDSVTKLLQLKELLS